MVETRGLLLTGVGGQGVILASMIVAEALLQTGCDVKQTEVHGMAQRGGSVFSHIRFGPEVNSPLVPLATAEVIAAFEWAEALRWLQYLRPGGAVVADVRRVVPPGACSDHKTWSSSYPKIAAGVLSEREVKSRLLDASSIAAGLGNIRAANSVVLGATAAFLDVPVAYWESAIERFVPPSTVAVNLEAFHAGRVAPDAPLETATEPDPVAAITPRIEIRHEWCKGCDICSRVCPEFCLSVDANGKLVAVAPEACTGCKLCEMLCPDFAISIQPGNPGLIPVRTVTAGSATS